MSVSLVPIDAKFAATPDVLVAVAPSFDVMFDAFVAMSVSFD